MEEENTNNVITIDANLLEDLVTPERGKSFITVDVESNQGMIIDYERLADAILSKIVKLQMPEDGLKLMIVE